MKLDYSGMQTKAGLPSRLRKMIVRWLGPSEPAPQREYDLVAIVQKRLAQNQAKDQ